MQTVWTFLVYFWLLGGGSSYPPPLRTGLRSTLFYATPCILALSIYLFTTHVIVGRHNNVLHCAQWQTVGGWRLYDVTPTNMSAVKYSIIDFFLCNSSGSGALPYAWVQSNFRTERILDVVRVGVCLSVSLSVCDLTVPGFSEF